MFWRFFENFFLLQGGCTLYLEKIWNFFRKKKFFFILSKWNIPEGEDRGCCYFFLLTDIARVSRSQQDVLRLDEEMSLKIGGKIDKSPCVLPLWWVKVVFLLVLCMLEHMCKGNLCQFWPPSGDSLCKRDFYKNIPLTTPLTILFWYIQTCIYFTIGWFMFTLDGQKVI